MNNYYELGKHSKPVTVNSEETQLWFDRGLRWCYSFNHEESIRCFQKSIELDPECAMAYWGVAYASGPNYNKPWEAFEEEELKECVANAHASVGEALKHLEALQPMEKDLIRALQHRYQSDQVVSYDEFAAWNDAYAAAMRDVYAEYSDDLDVATLYAESLMNRTPWQLWDLKSGLPAEGADTVEAMNVLEKAIQQAEDNDQVPHLGLLHMYIHVMEMSPHPERALRAADALRDLVPDAGHMCHMPTHIDILCGNYNDAVVSNSKAIVADRMWLEREGPINFYTLYRCHNYHFKLYAAMFLGQYKPALAAAEELIATTPKEVLQVEQPPMADWLEGFIPMKMHVLIRFGKWQEIIDEPLPDDPNLYCVTTAIIRYAKAVAHAASGNVTAAETEKEHFQTAFAKVPESRMVFNNTCVDILAIASEMLNGELEYRRGNHEQAFEHLRKSIDLDDNLPYDEPWGWMQPTRHALGALLLEQGRVEEAEQVYRADLGLDKTLSRPSQHPNNVWSLHGYVECLQLQEKHEEATAAQARLDLAMARADVPINASCFCRLDTCCDSDD